MCFFAQASNSPPPQIAAVLEEAWAPDYTYIGIIVDMDAVQKLQACFGRCHLGLN